jgi:hypothetical protein
MARRSIANRPTVGITRAYRVELGILPPYQVKRCPSVFVVGRALPVKAQFHGKIRTTLDGQLKCEFL